MPRLNLHYQDRVNRVLDYISHHLDNNLSLATLAEVACFSPYHFHRIFQAATGETLNNHVRRVRLERAAQLMKASPRKRITDVAMEAGFAGAAEFSRAFKSHFDRTASSWDRRSPLEKSKICKAPEMLSFYPVEELESWSTTHNVSVQLKHVDEFRYVYTRIFNPYGSARLVDAYYTLTAWLGQRGTNLGDIVVIGMSLDDPSVTPSENCRYDLGAAFPKHTGKDLLAELIAARGRPNTPLPTREECESAALTFRDLGPQEIAAVHCAGDIGHMDRIWQYLYRVWLPASAFEPADLPAMNIFVRLPEEIGWQTFDLQACIPVVRF
jgi:AraC-like DNA-binding protein/DNA gyrase inhibitor GyrI